MLSNLICNTGRQSVIIHFLENTEQNYPWDFAKVAFNPLSLILWD